MIRLCCVTALAAAAVFAPAKGVVAAGDPQEIELTAEQAVREALAANRDLQAARQTIAIARGRLLQAGRLSNPEFEMSGRDDFAFRDEGERGYGVGFAQSFPITRRLVRNVTWHAEISRWPKPRFATSLEAWPRTRVVRSTR